MKKTFKKRLSTVVMALTITTSLTMSALAVPNPTPDAGTAEDFTNNTATTTVNMLGMTDDEINDNLSATVPITMKLAVNGDGDVKGPDNYGVKNNSKTKRVKVHNIKGAVQTGYSIQVNVGQTEVDLKNITMKPSTASNNTAGGIKFADLRPADGHSPTSDVNWTMSPDAGTTAADSFLKISFGGTIPDVSKLSGNATTEGGEHAITLSYTLIAL